MNTLNMLTLRKSIVVNKARAFSCSPITNKKLDIEFDRKSPLIKPSKYGGSVEFYKGNYMVYDDNNMFIGNIKPKRYQFLKNKFCEHYDILKYNENEYCEKLWYTELNELMNRYSYKNQINDIYNKATLDRNILLSICSIFGLNTLNNFDPFNVPLNDYNELYNNFDYVSKWDMAFGSIEKNSKASNSFTRCSYSTANIKKHIKKLSDQIMTNKPSRHIITFPIIKNHSVEEFLKHFPCHTLLCVIPKNSVYLYPSDHWFDIEHKKLMNKYPIAVCLYYNEPSLLLKPITNEHLEQLEDVVNKNVIPSYNKLDAIKIKKPVWVKEDDDWFNKKWSNKYQKNLAIASHSNYASPEIVYTDASVRFHRNETMSSIGVWYGPNNQKNISQRVSCDGSKDVNFCELLAIYVAVLNSQKDRDLILYTDSYIALKLINEASQNPDHHVKNMKYRMIVEYIMQVITNRNTKTKLLKVKAHQGHVGNENADILARMGIYNESIKPIKHIDMLKYTRHYSKLQHKFDMITCMFAHKN